VDGWAGVALSGDFTVDGETVPVIAGREGFDRVIDALPYVDGEPPHGADQLALGASTAEDLGLEVGDEVLVGSPYGEHAATVSGLVVLPDLGPFQSDRTSLATGALLPGPLLLATYGNAREATGLRPEALADQQVAAILVDLAQGVAPSAVDLDARRFDPEGFGVVYEDPVRSPTIIDLAAVRGLPSALAGLFALAMVGAVVAGLAAGVRGRRGELAVVRALGATRRQRRASVRVQALTTVALGTAVGLPVGVVLARFAFRRLAQDIGVVDDVTVAVLLVVAVAGASLLLALVAAEVLARVAAGAQALRSAQISRSTEGPKSSLWT
jgi:putative ABC transport system permease protein